MTSFFESKEFQALQKECERSYMIYRFTTGYIKFQYDHSGVKWSDAFERTGGKAKWKHHNKFTEHFWNKYPEQFPPQKLEGWMMELFNVDEEELGKTVAFDTEEFDRCLQFQPTPDHYLEYTKFFPIARKLPNGLSMDQAVEFVQEIPFLDHLKARWMTTPMSEIHFSRDRTYNVTFFRPSLTLENGDVIFGGYNVVEHYVQIDGKKVSLVLS